MKDNKLTSTQCLEKKKLLLKLRNEIIELEKEIEVSKGVNGKRHLLRGLKYILKTAQLLAPYVLTVGITFGGSSWLGATPFSVDEYKYKLQRLKEFDSFGNIRCEEQYDKFVDSRNVITYYSEWTIGEDNFYSRDKETYLIKDITFDELSKIMNDNDAKSLKDIFGEPISTIKETKNNVSEAELKTSAYLQAVIYSEEKDDYVIVEESVVDNIISTGLWLLLTIIMLSFESLGIALTSDFVYANELEKIKIKYPLVDIDFLTKKLEIRKDNYERLTRK